MHSASVPERHAANRASWNEAAAFYTARADDTIAFIRAGKSNLHPIERANMGPLRPWCELAIHLQCASGRDTLSLWVEGAQRVVGVDISDIMIDTARRISAAVGAPAEWYLCDVLDTPTSLDGTADLVYTGRGAICWVHDLHAWAGVVARLLKPGGRFHLFEVHPVAYLFEMETTTLVPTGWDYFSHVDISRGWPSGYIGDSLPIPVEEQSLKYDRAWPIADVFNALHDVGLVIDYVGEHRADFWPSFPNLPPELNATLPHTFSLLARKPS
ncbi:MAG TPA: class I SAM-dependent methyltransferase [Chloroflexota bacterium]